jgi:hypothetical protein
VFVASKRDQVAHFLNFIGRLLLFALHAVEGLANLLELVSVLINSSHIDSIIGQFLYYVNIKLCQAILGGIHVLIRLFPLGTICSVWDLVLALAILIANRVEVAYQIISLDQSLLVLEYFLWNLELLQLAN